MKKPLVLVLLVSLGLNVYLAAKASSSRVPDGSVLASVGSKDLRLSDVRESVRGQALKLRQKADTILRREAEDWVASIVFPKEAAARSLSLNELLAKEIHGKVEVTPEDAYQRHVLAPSADPWPENARKVHAAVHAERVAAQRSRFLQSLSAKHGATIHVEGDAAAPRSFIPYRAPKSGPELSESGRVIAPPSLGPADAAVTLEVFSDFLCPFSQRFAPLVDQLRQKYPDKLRVIFHHFPLPMHAGAPLMHEASVCAQEQGKFWPFHDRLMNREPKAMDAAALSKLAAELGLDAAKFDACVQSGRYAARVERDITYGKKGRASGTPSYTFNGRPGNGLVPLETLSSYVDWYLKPSGPYPGKAAPPPAPSAPQPAVDPDMIHAFPGDWLEAGPSRGPKDAPVTMIEFYDYHCPFCQKGARIVDELLSKRGDVRLVSKQFPLSMHPNARKASEAAVCAGEQGKFWEFRSELLGASWGKQSVDDMKAAAAKLGLDKARFDDCLDAGKAASKVDEDMRIAKERGVSGTPAYFINGRSYFGAMPAPAFEAALGEAKAKNEK